ncbi:MAG: glycoside hydrolase family 16 protein [Wenzhouxiangellaceae bacterium]|nr:glycoside hydrolase family 16 protein [Wenzhouxiangellaceae bacterium]
MKNFLKLVAGALLAGNASAGWEVQWIERFDGDGVDWNNWTAQTKANYNNEVQCYTDDDSSERRNYEVSDGTLKIIARRDDVECPGLNGQFKSWTSGRLNSKDKQEFLYGRIESRIRFHNLEGGTWPAFWMLENRIAEQPVAGDGDDIGWPSPGASEIDVWEWFANEPDSYITNFFNDFGFACGLEERHPYPEGAADVLEWHVYAMEWTADEISFYMDDRLMASYDMRGCPVYQEPMFVLLNVAVGGNLGGAIDPDLAEATMEVDYVAHCQQSVASDADKCDQSTPQAFRFDYREDADGQWVNDVPEFAGNAQGLTLDYLPFADLLFVAWFTYVDAPAPDPAVGPDGVGASDNRWLTAQLEVDGNTAEGPIYASTGGRFDAPEQAGQETLEVGNMTIEFTGCDRSAVSYQLEGTGLARDFSMVPLEQLVNSQFRCKSEQNRRVE